MFFDANREKPEEWLAVLPEWKIETVKDATGMDFGESIEHSQVGMEAGSV